MLPSRPFTPSEFGSLLNWDRLINQNLLIPTHADARLPQRNHKQKPTIPHPTLMPTTRAGTIRSANDRTPLERKDPGKKPKTLDLANYLNEDVDFPPSLTRSTTKDPILHGANILFDLFRKPKPGVIPTPASTTLPSDTSMSQSNISQGVAVPAGGMTPPQSSTHAHTLPHTTGYHPASGSASSCLYSMTALELLLKAAFPGNIEIDIILGDTIQEHVHPNSAYPFLIQGLTDEETRILKNEFVLANEDIATFFYPYDTILPITDYTISLKGLVLTPSTQNDAHAAAELVGFITGLYLKVTPKLTELKFIE
ncbi:hypothetical protein M422DRAFT_242095 [Sphaerobolus stellatus SS14]|nr:hypothetical protein M422DRAFT_242095 [Sphaerobolus stellatus SS14]